MTRQYLFHLRRIGQASWISSVIGLGMGLALTAASPAVAQGKLPPGIPPGGPTMADEVEYWCNRNTKPLTNETRIACYTKWNDLFANAPKPPPPPQQSDGVCNVPRARENFYKRETVFGSISADLRDAIDGLSRPPPAGSTLYAFANFGPKGNRKGQATNRSGAKELLETARDDFEKNATLYATLSDNECFDCAVLEKWAVLKGAANLLSATRNFKEAGTGRDLQGTWVGLGGETELAVTKKDDKKVRVDPRGKMRPIAERPEITAAFPNTPYSNGHSNRKIVLAELTDQWLASIDPGYITKLKKSICELVITPKNAYQNPDVYFEYASAVQEIVNEGFNYITFDNAFDGEKPAEGERDPAPRIKIGIVNSQSGRFSKKCGPVSEAGPLRRDQSAAVRMDLSPFRFGANLEDHPLCAQYLPKSAQ